MKNYSLSHLADQTVDRDLDTLDARDRDTTADLLAYLAEFDARRLYVPAGYPSIFAYCVEKRRWSEDTALKRIQAARAAHRFPAIFPALADGRLHLSGVCLLAPYLTEGNAEDLLAAAANQTKAEIERLIAQRFPRSEMLAMVEAMSASSPALQDQHAPGHVAAAEPSAVSDGQHAPGHVETSRSKLAPVAAGRFALHVSIGQSMHDKLRYAQELLSHQVASGDVAEVLDRALDALIPQLEKAKFAATDRPRTVRPRGKREGRCVPADVKRAVWERDGGQCTFVSDDGHRCMARTLLQYDHIDPVARGGQATTERMRLLCRAHNQFEAEREFGVGFMHEKRQAARERQAGRDQRAMTDGPTSLPPGPTSASQPPHSTCPGACSDVIACLRNLGFRAEEARAAAALAESMQDAPLEDRIRVALKSLGKKPTRPALGTAA